MPCPFPFKRTKKKKRANPDLLLRRFRAIHLGWVPSSLPATGNLQIKTSCTDELSPAMWYCTVLTSHECACSSHVSFSLLFQSVGVRTPYACAARWTGYRKWNLLVFPFWVTFLPTGISESVNRSLIYVRSWPPLDFGQPWSFRCWVIVISRRDKHRSVWIITAALITSSSWQPRQ